MIDVLQQIMRMRVKKKFLLVLAACATIPMCLLLYSKLGADSKIDLIGGYFLAKNVGLVPPLQGYSLGNPGSTLKSGM